MRVIVCLLLGGPPMLSAQTVDTIVVENGNVFSGEDDAPAFVANLGNALHIRTRDGVIRRTLLFRTGAAYDSARVAESARLLRSLGVFRMVTIDTLRLGERFAVRVRTADGWSTKLRLSYRAAAGDATWSAGLTESNLLGTATGIGVLYRQTPDRDAVDLSHANPRLFGTRAQLRVRYSDLSDGRSGGWRVGLPFYQLSARRALETSGEVARERVLLFRDGVLDDSLERRATVVRWSGGIAYRASPGGYHRVVVTGQFRREDFALRTTSPFPVTRSGALGVYWEWGHARYRVMQFFQTFGRVEDVDVSTIVRLGAWVAPASLGYDRSGAGPEVLLQTGAVWRRGFARAQAQAQGIFTAGADSGLAVAGGTVVTQTLWPVTLIAHAEWGRLENPAPGAFFDLGLGLGGPRVLGIHAFTGTRMRAASFEARVPVTDDFLGLLAFGLSAFADYGGAWFGDEPRRLGGDVGLGVRLGATKNTSNEAYRIDVGYRFGDGFTGRRWAVAVGREIGF